MSGDVAAKAAAKALDTLRSPIRHTMAIDQAFDGTGVAFLFPCFEPAVVERFIRDHLVFCDLRYHGRADELVARLHKAIASGGGPLVLQPESKRAKEFGFGLLLGPKNAPGAAHHFPSLVLHAKLAFEASDIPEWEQSRLVARAIKKLALGFSSVAQQMMDLDYLVSMEGLALHGSLSSIAILPCLGILYGQCWEELSGHPDLGEHLREMPISSWKSAFSGTTGLKKNDTQLILYKAGFGRFGGDDESDAVAMAIVGSVSASPAKATRGRIRPTSEARERTREEKLAIALRRKVRLEAKETKEAAKKAKQKPKSRKKS